jgi:hypothetical protein
LVTNDDWPLIADGKGVIGTENECYNACGFTTTEVEYAVRMSQLKVDYHSFFPLFFYTVSLSLSLSFFFFFFFSRSSFLSNRLFKCV